MEEPVVREAGSDDVGVLTALVVELGYDASTSQVAARLEQHHRSDRDAVLVADTGGRVAGFVAVTVLPMIITTDDVARITALCVASTAQRRGVGRALLRAAERWAAGRGCARMEVDCGRRQERAAAHRFYPALGYRDHHGHHVLYERLLATTDDR